MALVYCRKCKEPYLNAIFGGSLGVMIHRADMCLGCLNQHCVNCDERLDDHHGKLQCLYNSTTFMSYRYAADHDTTG